MSGHLPAAHATRRPNLLSRVNPVTLLVVATVLAVPLLSTLDWVSSATALVIELLLVPWCGVALGTVARRSAPLVIAAMLSGLVMLLYGQVGGGVHWHWGLMTVSDNSVRLAEAIALRVPALALPSVVLFSGVDATRMADGLAQVFRLPARFVLGTLAGFRMLAVFGDDWRSIGRARRARGLGDTGRVRRFSTMAFGLLVVALRRGTRLATAMEVRGLGTSGVVRTWARPSRVGWPDAAAVLVSVLVMAIAIGAAVASGRFAPVWW